MLLIAPVLGPATFTVVPSGALPMTTYRIAFCVTMGMILRSRNKNLPLTSIFRSHYIKIVVVFSLFVIAISLRERFINIVFTFIPELILAFMLCFILIRDEEDLTRLAKIFVWQSAFISFFILIEYYTDFELQVVLMRTIPDYDITQLFSKGFVPLYRSEIYRPMGIDGNAVPTAYRLTFLMPLTLWYAVQDRFLLNKFWRSIPLLLTLIAIGVLQTRAAYVGVICSVFSMIIVVLCHRHHKIVWKIKRLTKYGMMLLFLCLIAIAFLPSISKKVQAMVANTIAGGPNHLNELSISPKVKRIPLAIEYFKKHPLTGYGSPMYALREVMKGADLPAPLIYILAGGAFLFLIYLVMIFFLPISVFMMLRKQELQIYQSEFLMYSCAAFVGGVLVVFSNWVETHFMIMNMLYISIYKVYRYKNSKVMNQ